MSVASANPPELSGLQIGAKEKALQWFDGPAADFSQPIFRIFGYAGTGKTTSTKRIVSDLNIPTEFAAFTGKAALVMQRNDMPASTLHSLIYKPIVPDKLIVMGIQKELKEAKEESTLDVKHIEKLYAKLQDARTISFELNDESRLLHAQLLVVDECSMVNQEMATDLLSFRIPILVLGDPGQLPPIAGTGALVQDKPDVLLTEIHRQAKDNPIIKLSILAREGIRIPLRDYEESKVCTMHSLHTDEIMEADQVLVGKNKTRLDFNRRFRSVLNHKSRYPVVGDKLICLRNNTKLGLLNGLICHVTELVEEFEQFIEYKLLTEDNKSIIVRILRIYFDEYETPGLVKAAAWWDLQKAEAFDFGYAITVHKSQGSQWDNILLHDDNFGVWDKKLRSRWLYTAVTRAAKRITIAG